MTDEVLFQHGTTMVRRLRLAPGEAMPWHRDPFQRVPVIFRGDLLSIEYNDGGESQRVQITPGQVEWEECKGRTLGSTDFWLTLSGADSTSSWCGSSTASPAHSSS